MSENTTIRFALLTDTNYASWEPEMLSFLQTRRLVKYTTKAQSTPPSDTAKLEDWTDGCQAAAGWIFQALSPSVRPLVVSEMRAGKPYSMWVKLEQRGLKKISGHRFNALEAQLNLRLEIGERLLQYYDRVVAASERRKQLREATYSVTQFDDELDAFTILRGLPEEFGHFATAI
ncbi:hypothetical protein EXIGLDRAFT_626876, partial [Exidia glandulosa HHB12029]